MTRSNCFTALTAMACLSPAAPAQVMALQGAQGRILDFDVRSAPLGPISGMDPVFQNIGIEEIRLVPAWAPGGDVLTAGFNVDGRALVPQDGELVIAEAGDALDDPEAGAGFDIRFSGRMRAFGAVFVDEINMEYTVEVFNAGSLVGSGTFTYTSATGGFPAPPVYWTLTGREWYDRIVITSTNGGGGWGLDDLAVGVYCYPDCDRNGSLDIFDFLCYQDSFVTMDPYANCDGNSVFDIFDFLCFQDSLTSNCF